jgi:hypothetical protein
MILAVVLVLLSAAITSALMVRSNEQSSDTSNDIADATSSGSMSLGAIATKKIIVCYFDSVDGILASASNMGCGEGTDIF